MNAISRPDSIQRYALPDARAVAPSAAETELARHQRDLNVHVLVMVFGAALAGYCGACIFVFGGDMISGVPVSVAMSPNPLSICAMAIFFAIAALCLLEARRSWSKSALAGARNGSPAREMRPSERLSRGGIQP
jgi:hypothetical protein